MTERTIGQKVGQWLSNLTVMIPLISALGLSSIYGNSETVKEMIHGKKSPLTTQNVTPDVEPVNYDRILKELIELNKKQDISRGTLEREINIQLDNIKNEIDELKQWHE